MHNWYMTVIFYDPHPDKHSNWLDLSFPLIWSACWGCTNTIFYWFSRSPGMNEWTVMYSQLVGGRSISSLTLTKIPVQTFANTSKKITCCFLITCSRNRPCRHVTYQSITFTQLLPVFSIKTSPSLAPTVMGHLQFASHGNESSIYITKN